MALKTLKVSSIIVLLLLSFSACISSSENMLTAPETDQNTETTEEKETEPIVIGGILPLTGDGAAYGIPIQRIADIAIAKVNSEGAINGRELQIIWEDGKCKDKNALAAAQKLINVDKVKVIYGAFCSSETLSAAPIAEAAGVILFSPGSSSPEITNAGDYIFRNYPSDSSQGVILANLASELGLTKVGMITEQNDYTIGIETIFKSTFEANGGTVITESFLPSDTNFKTQITKLTDKGIDTIFINPQTPAKANLLFKQIKEQNIEAQLFANDVVISSSDILTQYSELVEGMIGAEMTYDESHPNFKYFVSEYKMQTGESEVPFTAYAATSFDAMILLSEGIATVGHDPNALKDWLYNINSWPGTAGSLTIDANGDPLSGHQARIVKKGKAIPY